MSIAEFGRDHIDRDAAIERVGRFTVEYAELLHKADGVDPLSQEFGQLEKAESDMIETLVDDLATLGRGECELTMDGTDGCFGCSECLENIPPLANFCPNCGAHVKEVD